ncbi:hypothetical protein [Nonomuraea sp. SYSU D8015]|uniref:hypothetical protein n=1 Tax=Nonomuraea sp. SYSU D8015 TaxID=2593644 RepID=UPI001CB6DC1F|nr:hypothetical protein [Nonomuraea sp. SYSU D8015]
MSMVNKAGYAKEFDFADLPVAEAMQRSLAEVFAAQSKRWTSHWSADTYWRTVLDFARFLSELDSPPEDLGDLTPAMLKRWRTVNIGSSTGRNMLSLVRTLLQRDPRLASGPVAEELARRVPAPKPSGKSYSEAEREQVLLAAQRQFRSAWMRIRENTVLLERWQAGDLAEGSREWRIGQILDHLWRTGDVPRTVFSDGERYARNRRLLGGGSSPHTWGRLFLTRQELTSLAVLLTDRFAWNMSVYDRIPAPTAMPSAGETSSVTYKVTVEKRRAGNGRWFSTENITDSGADSPGRLITQALEATAAGRTLAARLAPGTDLLMVARSFFPDRADGNLDRPRPVGPLVFGISGYDARQFGLRMGGGSPFERSRRTTVTREGRPMQHTQGTHDGVYVLPNEHVQRASRAVIQAGAQEAVEQAQAVVFGGQLTQEPDPDHGQTATVDCADEATSPWPSPGEGCGADFLDCLGCRNARVHPGHHPRLAYLHHQLESLRSALDDRAWQRWWRDHMLRLEDLRKAVGPAAWKSALKRATTDDHTIVRLLVKGDLAP